jgi:cell division protein FtsQ
LQQVAARDFASAQPVDPRQLPVVIPALGRRALVGVGHVWVLHRRVVLQGVAAVLALAGIVGLYQARDALWVAGETVYRMVQGEFAAAGFGVERIEVSGQTLTRDEDIAAIMALSSGGSTLTFDVQKVANRLNWLSAVESATVRKVYPDKITIDLVEKQPLLRWRIGDATWLVDGSGAPIARDPGYYAELPLVVGDGAADDAIIMINTLNRYPALKRDLAALSRIGDRRWDLIYYTGLRVQLPEQGVAQALAQLDNYQRDFTLLDRDVTLIDLRVPGMVALKPAVREDAEDEKKKKKP